MEKLGGSTSNDKDLVLAPMTEVQPVYTGSGSRNSGKEIALLEQDTFSFSGVVCLGVSVINSWVVLVLGLGAGLTSGGSTAMVWGFLYATAATYCTVLSHTEMFAVYPTAGGQYHWSYLVSAPKYRAAVSWVTGMTNVIGLWLATATAAYLCATMVTSIILVNNPDSVVTPGQQYGIFVAMLIFTPITNVFVSNRANRLIEYGLGLLALVGALVIGVTLLATQQPKASASFVFAGVANTTGWDSTVIAWLIGLLQSQYAFVGFDIVYHVSEEMSDPKRNGPRAIKMVILISSAIAWLLLLAMLFCIPDVEAILDTGLGLPFAQLVINATGSRVAATLFILIILILFNNATRGNTIGVSRALLAFGRDGMLPYSHLFTIVKFGEPIYGLILSTAVALLVGLVQLGPAAAWNSLVGGATIFFFISYALPCLCMLLGGRKRLNKLHPDRLNNLGRWGVVCNLVAVFFVLQGLVIYCFPATRPVTADNMNYVIVYCGFFGLALVVIWFVHGRHHYHGPDEATLRRISGDDKL